MQTEEEILKIKKVKNTAVRTVVLRHLLSLEKAQSLKDIVNALPYMDRSSIFRTLKTFEENKVIHSIEDGSGMTKYAVVRKAVTATQKICTIIFIVLTATKRFVFSTFLFPIFNFQKISSYNKQIWS